MSVSDYEPRLLKQPFLLFRLIIFLIIAFLNFLILILSAWNVTAARISGYQGPVGASFALFNSCMFLFLLIFAFADFIFPRATTSLVKFEIGWTGVLTVLNFAASIIGTSNGPPLMCNPGVNENVCVSATLLVPVSWLSSLLILSYFTTLLVVTLIHIQVYPNVINVPIVVVQWFPSQSASPKRPKDVRPGLSDRKQGKADIEKQLPAQNPTPASRPKTATGSRRRTAAFSVASLTPQWAKAVNGVTKRGIHTPFARPSLPVPSLPVHNRDEQAIAERLSYWLGHESNWEIATPPQPKSVRVNNRVGEGLYEVDRHAVMVTVPSNRSVSPPSDSGCSTIIGDDGHGGERKSVSSLFPPTVKDWDQPLQKPSFRKGEGQGWRRADNTRPKGNGWRA